MHLPFLQAGAWIAMFHERAGQEAEISLLALASEIVSGLKPCQRCILIREASVESPDNRSNESRAPEIHEFRLAVSERQAIRIVPPAPRKRGYPAEVSVFPASRDGFPPAQPPDPLA
ncbi:MAG: hypothetical protein WD342_04880 [Verrucomicrobiales bacterium]